MQCNWKPHCLLSNGMLGFLACETQTRNAAAILERTWSA